jgi:DNA-binding beta-propeller fold protein YncE
VSRPKRVSSQAAVDEAKEGEETPEVRWLRANSGTVAVAALALVVVSFPLGGVTALKLTEWRDRSGAPTDQIVVTADGGPKDGSFSYVIVDGGFRVYDIEDSYRRVQSVRLPDSDDLVIPRGVAGDADADRLYASYLGTDGGDGHLVAYNLRRNRVIWHKRLPIDSFALTTDGRKIYMPCGEGRESCDYWTVLDARTGDELSRIAMHESPHNTIASLDGDRVYLASSHHDQLAVVDPKTDRIVDWVGPFRDSIRPFTITRDRSLAFVTVDFLSGFEVANLETGAKLFTVEVEGFPVAPGEFPTLPVTQSHGIALTPDEQEVWVADDVHNHVHVYDVRGVPNVPSRQIADIPLADSPKWINFTRDGRHAHISTGEIVDRRTRRIVALVEPSRHFVQIDWEGGQPARAYSRYGLGYGASER